MTGIEFLALFGGAVGLFAGLIGTWVVLGEREKALLLSSLRQGFDVLEERRGNLDRPLGLLLRGSEAVVDVDAVLRGDHELWQLRQREVWAPAWAGLGPVVIVDVDWRDAVRELRGLVEVGVLSARYVVYAREASLAGPCLQADLAGELVTALRLPTPAKCVVIDADVAGRVQVFLELPRAGLTAKDTGAAIGRLRVLVRLLGGERGVSGAVHLLAHNEHGAHSPSGAPLAVPSPT